MLFFTKNQRDELGLIVIQSDHKENNFQEFIFSNLSLTLNQFLFITVYNQLNMKVLFLFTIVLIISLTNCDNLSSQPQNQVYAVLAGYPVTVSSIYNSFDNVLWRLDEKNYGWGAGFCNSQQWIQVSSQTPVQWKAVITQGKAYHDQWVLSYKVSYSLNGKDWHYVDDGRVFAGNKDRNSQVRNDFKSCVVARAIRIHPIQWFNHISMRIDAIFIAN